MGLAEREGFEPSEQVTPLGGLANRCTRPLCDLSIARRAPCYHSPIRLPEDRCVAWLVDRQLRSIGQADATHEAPTLVLDLPRDLCAASPQVRQRRLDVACHEVQLDPRGAIGGVDAELGGRQ